MRPTKRVWAVSVMAAVVCLLTAVASAAEGDTTRESISSARQSGRVKGHSLDRSLTNTYVGAVAKITGKFQVTLPKRLAEEYELAIGDEIEFVAAGDSISIIPSRIAVGEPTKEERIHQFDEATQRQRIREKSRSFAPADDRGWSREDLYTRGRAR
ncbi:MAG: AbrB/MazE/SpoVT family DNA-binding domain-containing protein [Acidimicrobiia bacterium]|nr:AbrB/MazE/SpoVT family DNA-binding domain-containing protein [Acidimicrobiia bacterium]